MSAISESLKLEFIGLPSIVILILSFISSSGFALNVRVMSLSRSTPAVAFAGSAVVISRRLAQTALIVISETDELVPVPTGVNDEVLFSEVVVFTLIMLFEETQYKN